MCRFQATVWVSPKYYLITIRIGICKSSIMTTKTVSSFLFLSFHALIIIQMNVLDIDWGWSKIANTAKKEERIIWMWVTLLSCEKRVPMYHAKKNPNAKHLNVLQMIIIVD